MKFFDQDGNQVPHGIVDGYDAGDRILEGVMFEVHPNPSNNTFTVNVRADSERYFNTLNKKYWLKEVRDILEETIEDDPEYAILHPEREDEFLVIEFDKE